MHMMDTLADELIESAKLVCFDEFQVTDIAGTAFYLNIVLKEYHANDTRMHGILTDTDVQMP